MEVILHRCMDKRIPALLCSVLAGLAPSSARTLESTGCGTYRGNGREELFLHQQSERARILHRTAPGAFSARAQAYHRALIASALAANKDYGNIAVIEDSDGVVARQNDFDLDKDPIHTVRFAATAGATRYGVYASGTTFDSAASTAGTFIALSDDDSRLIQLPFSFPFFGKTYQSIYVNSDGNLTFGQGDSASTDRSLGRVSAGPPRIAPLFSDLDPSGGASGGVHVFSDPSRVVVTWNHVPLFGTSGTQTFQVRLFPDGSIEFAYNGTSVASAVVGIAPGSLTGSTQILDLTAANGSVFTAGVVERFTGTDAVDIATTAQKFYATHDDAYDYLVIYNSEGIDAKSGAIAYEVTVRNDRSGYGDEQIDTGAQYGSPRRLQAVMNMGPLSQYAPDPGSQVQLRFPTPDTPTTVLAHEAGHLFLAFASVRDENDNRIMLNPRNNAHWAFTFNSDASVLEGNRIQDDGNNRFHTTGAVQGYSPLDQYLMGFRPPPEVPDTFVVVDADKSPSMLPRVGVGFNGSRQNVAINQLIDTEGRRTPDYTVAQRNFRFAFILIVPAGQAPDAATIQQVDTYRTAFEAFFGTKATSNLASADTSLRRAVQFSGAPAMGILVGSPGVATLSLAAAPASPLSFDVRTSTGAASAASPITIAAGKTSAALTVTGLKPGVEEITITPADSSYETVKARIQVSGAADGLSLAVIGGDRQAVGVGQLPDPVLVRVEDINRLPYPNVRVNASVTSGGSLDATSTTTDENGIALFRWTPSESGPNELTATIAGAAASVKAVALSRPAILNGGIGNAASYATTLAPGGIAALYGTNLTGGVTEQAMYVPLPYSLAGGVQVAVNGSPVPLYYASDGQINFVVPESVAGASSLSVVVSGPGGASAPASVRLAPVQPGLFSSPTNGIGSVLVGNTSSTTDQQPARAGADTVSIYCTGLGTTHAGDFGLQWTDATPQVFIGGQPAPEVQFSGLNQYFPGLYQVNVNVPASAGRGVQPLKLFVNGIASNEVKIVLQ